MEFYSESTYWSSNTKKCSLLFPRAFSEHQLFYWGLVFDPFRVDSCEGWKIRLSFHFSAFVRCHGAVVVLSYVGHLSNSIPYGSVCAHTEPFLIALKHSLISVNGDTSNRISFAKNYSGWLQSFALPYEFLFFYYYFSGKTALQLWLPFHRKCLPLLTGWSFSM